MQAIHGIIDNSTFIYPFESEKCGKEVEKSQNFEYKLHCCYLSFA